MGYFTLGDTMHRDSRASSPLGSTYAVSLGVVLLLTSIEVHALSVQCKLGTARCVKSQGTEIPSKQAVEILDRCQEFIVNDLGRAAMRLSHKEILDRSGGRITPLVRAWHAYDDLIDSPLKFERKANAEEASYANIKHACLELGRDFNNDSKWTK